MSWKSLCFRAVMEEFYFYSLRLKLWYNIQPIHYENTPTEFSSFRSKNTSPPTQNDQLLNEYFCDKSIASESGLSPENDQNI
ncbi:unnamed protein product [Rhizophagus irregularis]|nr:unnamed protein product [Rhizophagus irregularis]